MAATAGLIIGAAAIVHAQQSSGPGSSIPSGGVSGPRAAGGASGHPTRQKRGEPGKPGGAGFAPGGTTGAGSRDDRIGDDRDEPMPDNRQDRLHDSDDRPTTGDIDDRR